MMDKSIRDKVKEDFKLTFILRTPLESYFTGIGYSKKGEDLELELRFTKGVPQDVLSKLPKAYFHETGEYSVNYVTRKDKFKPRS